MSKHAAMYCILEFYPCYNAMRLTRLVLEQLVIMCIFCVGDRAL